MRSCSGTADVRQEDSRGTGRDEDPSPSRSGPLPWPSSSRCAPASAIHFRSKPDKLEDGLAGRLVLKLAQDPFVDDGVVWVVDRIIAGVKVVGVGEHVGVDVGGCDLVAERVGVDEDEPRSVPVRRLHVSVVELIHEPLAEL